jgi:hypothetical protein
LGDDKICVNHIYLSVMDWIEGLGDEKICVNHVCVFNYYLYSF